MTIESSMRQLCKDLSLELIPMAVTAAGVPIPPQITHIVLNAFVELLTEEKSNLSGRLETLLGSYYKGAIDFLVDARYAEQVETRNEAINQARDRFNTASYVEEDPLLKVKSQFYIGVCYDLQNEKDLAKIWYERAYTSASQLAFQLQSPQSGVLTKTLEPLAATWDKLPTEAKPAVGILTTFFVPGGWEVLGGIALYKKYKRSIEEQRRKELEKIHHFMDPLVPVLQAHSSTLPRNRIDASGQ